ncbi:hypothetical protein LTS15_005504 [Exophiala xenobiotica]|nr:hypothetical protein LTS15_005504 [Exophiala xenobiotica]
MIESKEISAGPITEIPSQNHNKIGTVYPVNKTLNRHGKDYAGKYRRSFLSHHIQIVILGSNIESNLFISTGKALRNAGPGNMIIGYMAVMTMVIAMLQALTEMTVAFPVSGSLIDFQTVPRQDDTKIQR